MLLGVTLSHLHQSSLGTLMTLIPHKVNVLWWSEHLPLLFLFSAMMAGPAVAILEHLAAARWLGFEPRMDHARRPGPHRGLARRRSSSRFRWAILSTAAPWAPC